MQKVTLGKILTTKREFNSSDSSSRKHKPASNPKH